MHDLVAAILHQDNGTRGQSLAQAAAPRLVHSRFNTFRSMRATRHDALGEMCSRGGRAAARLRTTARIDGAAVHAADDAPFSRTPI